MHGITALKLLSEGVICANGDIVYYVDNDEMKVITYNTKTKENGSIPLEDWKLLYAEIMSTSWKTEKFLPYSKMLIGLNEGELARRKGWNKNREPLKIVDGDFSQKLSFVDCTSNDWAFCNGYITDSLDVLNLED